MSPPRLDGTTPPPVYIPPPPPPKPQDRPGETTHTVRPGENLDTIADDHHTTPQSILKINPQVRDPSLLSVGEVLHMPPVQVAPDVAKTVDAVIAPGATPQQKNEAQARVQDIVDATGTTPDALPAKALSTLSDAGLPAVDARVLSSVDQMIGQHATTQQRLDGYQALGAYVDQVGGIGDAGITDVALPAQAGTLLAQAGTPVRIDAAVVTASNGLLKPDATAQQRQDAYSSVQRYVDQVGGVGDAGITADALPAKATQLLAAAGNPALRFDPAVVASVDKVIAPGSFDSARLSGYETVQRYVDQVGGVGDAGITAEALPARSIALLRDQHIALDTSVPANATSGDIVTTALAGATPQAQLQILQQGFAKADPAVRQQLLADPKIKTLIGDAVDTAVAPLQHPDDSGGQAVPAMEATKALDTLTRDLDPVIVAAMIKDATPAFASYHNERDGTIGPQGMASLLTVMDRAAGTTAGDAAIAGFAQQTGLYSLHDVEQFIAAGGTPTYAAAMGNRDDVISGTSMYGQKVGSDVDAYTKHTEELSWLVQNHGGAMTPTQLNKAIDDYVAKQGPGWKEKADQLKERVAQDGMTLQKQIDTLQRAGGYDDQIKSLIDDPKNAYALSTMLGTHPEVATPQSLREFATLTKYGDSGRKLLGEAANAYAKSQVLPALQNANPDIPGSVQRAEAALDKLRNSDFATAIGIDKKDAGLLNTAVDDLKKTLATSGDDEAKLTAKINQLGSDLDGLKGFDKTTAAGQLFRSIGVAAGAVGLAFSLEKAGLDPGNALNWVKVSSDTLGVAQKTSEVLAGRGSENALVKAGAKSVAGTVVGGLAAGVDAAFSIKAFVDGDVARGSLYATAAAGGGLAALGSAGVLGAWAGPVGIGLAAIGAVGLSLLTGSDESNKHMNATSAAFLRHAGFNESAAKALVDQSGDGYSPVPILQTYAERKGLHLDDPQQQKQFVDWINGMGGDQLASLRDALHHTLDDIDGNPDKLGASTDVPATRYDVNPSTGSATPVASVQEPRSVGDIDAFLTQHGIDPLPVT